MNRWLRKVIVLLVLAHTSWADAPAGAPPHPGKLVDVGGYRVHLYCTGKGSPVVVVTGAAYSFDWGLVQPAVSETTTICTYDHSGIAWSDPGPEDSCNLRINELHAALLAARISGPYVLVGHSLGALVARLYQQHFPAEVSGMVFVDHAQAPITRQVLPSRPGPLFGPVDPPSMTAMIGSQETNERSFQKLPPANYKLHVWADSLPKHQEGMSRNGELVKECSAQLSSDDSQIAPLANLPLIVLGTAAVPEKLAHLSRDEKTEVVSNSGHFIMIDRPDAVINAIGEMVQAVRSKTSLGHPD